MSPLESATTQFCATIAKSPRDLSASYAAVARVVRLVNGRDVVGGGRRAPGDVLVEAEDDARQTREGQAREVDAILHALRVDRDVHHPEDGGRAERQVRIAREHRVAGGG